MGTGMLFLIQKLQKVHAALARHGNIQKNQFHCVVLQKFHGLVYVGSLACILEIIILPWNTAADVPAYVIFIIND